MSHKPTLSGLKTILLVLVTLLQTSQWVNAATDPLTDSFRTFTLNIPNRLLSKGITKAGDLNIQALAKQIKTVKWVLIPQGLVFGSGFQRSSAVYNIKHRAVVITPDGWSQATSTPVREVLALHESLGALGYLDEHYEVSIPLYFLSTLEENEMNRVHREAFKALLGDISKRKTSKITYFSQNGDYLSTKKEGGTGVGGGGDAESLKVKQTLLDPDFFFLFKVKLTELYPQMQWYSDSETIERITLIGMESTDKNEVKYFSRQTSVDQFGFKLILNREAFSSTDLDLKTGALISLFKAISKKAENAPE